MKSYDIRSYEQKTEMKVTVSVYLHNVIVIVGRLLLKHVHVNACRHVVLLTDRTATQYDWLLASSCRLSARL